MRLNKMKSISLAFNSPFDTLIKNFYLKDQMSAQEISDHISKQSKIFITARSIQRQLKLNLAYMPGA